MSLPEPNFIDRDPSAITVEIIAQYEADSGKTLQPAQPERLMVNQISYRESLVRIAIQEAAKQCLLHYAKGVMLDYLGELVGCPRLDARSASVLLRFTLVDVQAIDVTIPAGTRVQSEDGTAIFATDADVTIAAGDLTGDVSATAETAGVAANDYQAGDINALVQPLALVEGVASLAASGGGAEVELDDHYRDRIKSAPESFSVAGPRGAYLHWGKSAHADIIAIELISSGTGIITLYPLTKDGAPSQEILDAVVAICSDEDIRPLDDVVQAAAPTQVDFAIDVDVTLYASSTDTDLQAKANIEADLAVYTAALRQKLGVDLVLKQIEARISNYRGVYKPVLNSPVADRVLERNEWLNCTGITVRIAGRVNG